MIQCIVKEMPQEVEVNLTDTLKKKLVKSPLVRYNKNDYICKRVNVENLALQACHNRTTLIVPVVDYWIRCTRDPRYCVWPKAKVVFKLY